MTEKTFKINGQDILILIEENQDYVAIKPICKAIGVNYTTQLEKISEDEVLSKATVLRKSVGANGKFYKMRVIPLRFAIVWLVSINPKNVKSELRKQMTEYKKQCYNVLFNMFTKRTSILKEREEFQMEIDSLEKDLKQDERYVRIQELKASVSDAEKQLNSLD